MSIQINQKEVSEIYIDEKQISEIYIGEKLFFSNTPNNVKYYKGNDGFFWATALDPNNKDITKITIKGNIFFDGYERDVSGIVGNSFSNCKKLTKVKIKNSNGPHIVKDFTFGYTCFFNCSSLTDVFLPDIPISIGEKSFESTAIKSFIIKKDYESNYGNPRIENRAFGYCKDLSKVIIAKGHILKGAPFLGCNPDKLYVYVRNTEEETKELQWNSGWSVYGGTGYNETPLYLPHVIYGYKGE